MGKIKLRSTYLMIQCSALYPLNVFQLILAWWRFMFNHSANNTGLIRSFKNTHVFGWGLITDAAKYSCMRLDLGTLDNHKRDSKIKSWRFNIGSWTSLNSVAITGTHSETSIWNAIYFGYHTLCEANHYVLPIQPWCSVMRGWNRNLK